MDYATAPVVREVSGTPHGSDAVGGSERARTSGFEPADSGSAAADPDALDELGDEIATLAAHIHAGTHRFLVLVARFDRLGGWERAGHRSCAHWLAYRTGLDPGTAREHVRVARKLEVLPETSRAMARGALSFSQTRALTRVARPETEGDLLELAEGTTTAHLERVVRAWKRGSRQEEAEWERERHRSRALSVFPGEDGVYVVKGRLDPEVGALLMRAVEAASDALYRERRLPDPNPERGRRERRREAARRRADALGLVAERALAAGFGGGRPESDGGRPESGSEEGSCGHACGCRPPRAKLPVPISGSRAERYQVVLHVAPETLASEEPAHEEEGSVSAETSGPSPPSAPSPLPETSHLEDGTRVSAETSRRLACDAGLVRVTRARDGAVLDVGRRSRTIPPALRRALEVRDGGCRFPGCGLRFTDAHHLTHWADGGETSLENTLLLCRYHHRLVHEGGWRVEHWGEERATAFIDPRGQVHLNRGWRRVRARGAGRPRGSGPRSDGRPPAPSGRPDGRSGRPGGPSGWRNGTRDPVEALPSRPVASLPRDTVAALLLRNRRQRIQPDAYTAGACWKRERDIPDDVLFRAIEAALD